MAKMPGRDGGPGSVAQIPGCFQHSRCESLVFCGETAHYNSVVHRVEDVGASGFQVGAEASGHAGQGQSHRQAG